jgi:hypothetical protein
MTTVRMNVPGIEQFFRASPLAGAGTPGVRSGTAERLATRMVILARQNASGRMMYLRTGGVADSVRPIIRPSPRGGTEVGVGTVSPIGGHLANGTQAHEIRPSTRGVKFLRSNGPLSKGFNPTPLRAQQRKVNHPGNRPIPWLRNAVDTAIGRPSL